jgi:hypothetical protein
MMFETSHTLPSSKLGRPEFTIDALQAPTAGLFATRRSENILSGFPVLFEAGETDADHTLGASLGREEDVHFYFRSRKNCILENAVSSSMNSFVLL